MAPKKLKDDCIVEAICDVRFEADAQPEVILGRLSDVPLWSSYHSVRLPVIDIPVAVRQANPLLKFQPVFQLREESGPKLVKLGVNSLSIHVVGTGHYVGWEKWYPFLEQTVSSLFDDVRVSELSRVGLRYINVLTASRHKVRGIHELDLDLQIRSESVKAPFSVSLVSENGADMTGVTRVASPEFVEGPLSQDAAAVVDVDVGSSRNLGFDAADAACKWIQLAHDFEKELFFALIPEKTLRELVDEH